MQVRSIILVCLLTLASFFPAFADEIKIIKELNDKYKAAPKTDAKPAAETKEGEAKK